MSELLFVAICSEHGRRGKRRKMARDKVSGESGIRRYTYLVTDTRTEPMGQTDSTSRSSSRNFNEGGIVVSYTD